MRLVMLALVLLAGCSPPPLGVRLLPGPAPEGARLPWLAAGPSGDVLLSWVEPAGEGRHRLKVARWDRGWAAARTIATGEDWFVNWADVPSVLPVGGGGLAAHWLEKEGDGPYAYGVRVSFSGDGGASWSAPFSPHEDGTESEHGFVSLLAPAEGGAGAVWLDGRETVAEPAGPMTLRARSLSAGGQTGPEEVVDERVCDCCPTAGVVLDDGTWVVAYRDRGEDEVRDIRIARRVEGRWEAGRLAADGWVMPGCPVNGPSLAASGRDVAAAWYTEGGGPSVRVAVSRDGGATFGEPVRVDEGAAIGRAAVAFAGPRLVVVLWLEKAAEEGEARLLVRPVTLSGEPGPVVEVGRTGVGRAAGFPRLVPAGPALMAAWTDVLGQRPVVRTARIAPAHAPD